MYAIIQTGGKQYKVAVGNEISVEKLNAAEGDEVSFDVLLLERDGEILLGKPVIDNVRASGKVVEHGKGKKVIVFKYKPKKDFRKKNGHRQPYTKVVITAIG